MRNPNLPRLMVALTLCLAVCASTPRPAFGHADIEVRIADLTKKIEADPANAELYLKRGELHRLHRDWESALADYRRVAELDPTRSTVHLARGRMLHEAERPLEALVELDRFLAIVDVADTGGRREALVTRARAKVALARYEEAAGDYTSAIATLDRHTPEYYLERSQARARAGLRDEALRGLDEAIERAGHLVALELRAIELELELERYDGALARLDTISRWMPAEILWFRRGEVLRRAGRVVEARLAYEQALELVEAAPPERRFTRAFRDLGLRLRAAVAEGQER